MNDAPHFDQNVTEGSATTSPMEAALAGLWASILETETVGKDDDFLALGGDSVRFASLISSVNALFDIDLSTQASSCNLATVSGMARAIETARSRSAADIQSPAFVRRTRNETSIQPRKNRGAVPLSHTQRRMWFLAEFDRSSANYNQSHAYRLAGIVDEDALTR